MKQNNNAQIKAKATAREFPSNAFPLKFDDGKYARNRNGHLIVTDGDKILNPTKEIHNTDMFVNVGKYFICDILIGATSGQLTHIGVGSCTSTPVVTDTTLVSTVGNYHLYTDRFRATNIATLSTFFSSSENNGTWNETGLFTGASGIMFCRSTFAAPITKSSTNTQTIDFDITVT